MQSVAASSLSSGSIVESASSIATRFIERLGELIGEDFHVDEVRTCIRHETRAIEFTFSRLPRAIATDVIGEVFFNKNDTHTERGSVDGDAICLITMDELFAVLDVQRGRPDYQRNVSDAYLSGVAYLFDEQERARAFATRYAEEERHRYCAAAIKKSLHLGFQMSPRNFAGILHQALRADVIPPDEVDRDVWIERMVWFLLHPKSV